MILELKFFIYWIQVSKYNDLVLEEINLGVQEIDFESFYRVKFNFRSPGHKTILFKGNANLYPCGLS